MKSLVLLLLVAPLTVRAQEEGVRFERGVSWQQVQAKAKAANKHVLVHLCTPRSPGCQLMDTSVFVHPRVGAAINTKFIAVKVRGDASTGGDAAAGNLYIDAPTLRQYKVTRFPTFLFFAPSGRLVHRAAGQTGVEEFLALAAEALDPAKQYDTQLERYNRGARDYGVMVYLAGTARALGELEVARRIARDYIDHLSAGDRYRRENIRFIAGFTERSTDPGFAMFLQRADTVDQVMGRRGYAQGVTDQIVTAEEIAPLAFPGGTPSTATPDWGAISAVITKKYGAAYAERTVLDAQIKWSGALRRWPEVARYTALKLERHGANLDSGTINGLAWDLFLRSDNEKALVTAIARMEPVAKAVVQDPAAAGFMGPAYVDTYANLLHKVGRTADAVAWQERAVQLAPKDGVWWKAHADRLAKMKMGKPTWPQEGD